MACPDFLLVLTHNRGMGRFEDFQEGITPTINFLGASGTLRPRLDYTGRQNMADRHWMGFDPQAGKTISEQGARDLVGETIHHRAMDEIPGIEGIRKNFNPNKHVELTDDLPPSQLGHLSVDLIGRQMMHLGNTIKEPLRTGTVTHETAHLLTHPTMHNVMLNNYKNYQSIAHYWPMARAHIYAARHALSNDTANHLRGIYNAFGVPYGKKAI